MFQAKSVSALTTESKILVIAVARIGDTLLATPAMRAAKAHFPRGRLSVLAHPGRLEVLENLPFIDSLFAITKVAALWRGWMPGNRHDLALVYGQEPALVRYALRVARRVFAFQSEGMPRNERLQLLPARSGTHAASERARLAEAAGIAVADTSLAYRVRSEELDAARHFLQTHFSDAPWPLICLQTRSFPTKSHRDWPIGHFVELAKRILTSWPRAGFVVLGDKHARDDAGKFAERTGGRVAIAAGGTSLRESAALMAVADLYVGVDTGPTHIAGALRIPMVALYHSHYPGRNLMPLAHPACRVIEHPATGRIDSAEAAMADISVDSVWDAARALLEARLVSTPQGTPAPAESR